MTSDATVRWSPRARQRLLEILREIRDDAGPAAARDWAKRLFHAPDALAGHPRMGRMVPELARPDIREILLPPYRILYRLRRGTCQILTVRHSRQLTTSRNFSR